MLLLQHAIITTLIALVASILHFATQHKLQTREEWLSIAIPLHYMRRVFEQINLKCKSENAAAPARHNHFSHSTGRKYSPLRNTAQTANKRGMAFICHSFALSEKSVWALNLICKSDHAAAPARHNRYSRSTGRKCSQLCDTAQTSTERGMASLAIPLHYKKKVFEN